MSDLFKQEVVNEKNFNPEVYLRDLCRDTKIEVASYADIQITQGWQMIVEDFIDAIKTLQVKITRLNNYQHFLDIKFEMIDSVGENEVWRALENARNDSLTTCANCGEIKTDGRSHACLSVLCAKCLKNAGLINKTGTWLDKY